MLVLSNKTKDTFSTPTLGQFIRLQRPQYPHALSRFIFLTWVFNKMTCTTYNLYNNFSSFFDVLVVGRRFLQFPHPLVLWSENSRSESSSGARTRHFWLDHLPYGHCNGSNWSHRKGILHPRVSRHKYFQSKFEFFFSYFISVIGGVCVLWKYLGLNELIEIVLTIIGKRTHFWAKKQWLLMPWLPPWLPSWLLCPS